MKLGIFKEHRDTENYLQEFKKFVSDIIIKRRDELKTEFEETKDIQSSCILSILIKEGTIYKFTDKELIDNFFALFVAGTDTSSHLVGMAIYFLS